MCREAVRLERVHLFEEDFGVDNASVADDRLDVRIHDPGGNQVQLQRAPTVNDGVTSVVASLEANDVVEVISDEICDLAFALVAPLGADEHYSSHGVSVSSGRQLHRHTVSAPALRYVPETVCLTRGGSATAGESLRDLPVGLGRRRRRRRGLLRTVLGGTQHPVRDLHVPRSPLDLNDVRTRKDEGCLRAERSHRYAQRDGQIAHHAPVHHRNRIAAGDGSPGHKRRSRERGSVEEEKGDRHERKQQGFADDHRGLEPDG